MIDHDFHNSLTVSFEEPEDKRGYEPDTNSSSWFVSLMILVGLVLVGIGMWPMDKATPVPNISTQQSQFAKANFAGQNSASLSQPAYTTKAIEQIRLGDRVLGQNPQVSDEERDLFLQVDPATWRHIRLRMTKPDGSLLHINYLRPLLWLEQTGAAVSQTIPLDLGELGVAGNALVLEINPCPTIKKGPGQVVTGTYVHQKADIIDLTITSQSNPIGTTANHPFWSEDRHAFVEAGKLYVGEQLRTMEGRAKVVSINPRAGPQVVYNLEVNGENVYQVGQAGLLVHNYSLYINNGHHRAVAAKMAGLKQIKANVDGVICYVDIDRLLSPKGYFNPGRVSPQKMAGIINAFKEKGVDAIDPILVSAKYPGGTEWFDVIFLSYPKQLLKGLLR